METMMRMVEVPLFEPPMFKRRRFEDAVLRDGFSRLSEAVYMAEQKAKEAVTTRWKAERDAAMREKERREQESRTLAQKARFEGRTEFSDKTVKDMIKRLKKVVVNGDTDLKCVEMETEDIID